MKRAILVLAAMVIWCFGCAATEAGKDTTTGDKDTYGSDGTLDGGNVPTDAEPSSDGPAPEIGEGEDGAVLEDAGWTGDLVEDVPVGIGEVFQEELCTGYCNVMVECGELEGNEACLTDCATKSAEGGDFAVQADCVRRVFEDNGPGCGGVEGCLTQTVEPSCEGACQRVGECGFYTEQFANTWGTSKDECIVSCSNGANQEGFDVIIACLTAGLETCSITAIIGCFEKPDDICNEVCSGNAVECGLVGSTFATGEACYQWCVDQGWGGARAFRDCVGELGSQQGIYFGWPMEFVCKDFATENCVVEGLTLPSGIVSFTAKIKDLCAKEEDLDMLPEIMAWSLLGMLEAAQLLDGADFDAAETCLAQYETCPGKYAWLDCFVPEKWASSADVCTSIMDCEEYIGAENLLNMTYGDCVFYCDFGTTSQAAELADMKTCIDTAQDNCEAIKVCVMPPESVQ